MSAGLLITIGLLIAVGSIGYAEYRNASAAERRRHLWKELAEAHGLTLTLGDRRNADVLAGTIDDVAIRVTQYPGGRDYSDGSEFAIEASELPVPDDLSLGPVSALREVLGRDRADGDQTGDDAFDRDVRIERLTAEGRATLHSDVRRHLHPLVVPFGARLTRGRLHLSRKQVQKDFSHRPWLEARIMDFVAVGRALRETPTSLAEGLARVVRSDSNARVRLRAFASLIGESETSARDVAAEVLKQSPTLAPRTDEGVTTLLLRVEAARLLEDEDALETLSGSEDERVRKAAIAALGRNVPGSLAIADDEGAELSLAEDDQEGAVSLREDEP